MEEVKPTIYTDRRLKILINTNAPWTASGYAREAEHLLPRFLKDGWQVALNAFVGHEGHPRTIDGILTYPKMGDTWGSDALVFNGRHFGAHVVLTFQDVWTLNPQFLQQLNNEGRKFIAYVPIDQEPIPQNVLQNLRFCYKIITFSKFGQKALMKAGFTSTLIQEGTDLNVFKPLDKMQCRKELNIPLDKFVIGMVGANKENPPRKGWQQALEAFKRFHDKHPDSLFFFHTNQNSPGGFPILQYAHELKIDNALFKMDDYMATFHTGSEIMNKLYNSFDFLSHASLSEGFGLCIAEAQAAGCPVIVNDCDSMPELVIDGKTGFICKTGFKWYTNALGFYHFPDVDSLYEKYELMYEADRIKMGQEARKHIEERFNIDTIVEKKWNPFWEQLQKEILGEPQS